MWLKRFIYIGIVIAGLFVVVIWADSGDTVGDVEEADFFQLFREVHYESELLPNNPVTGADMDIPYKAIKQAKKGTAFDEKVKALYDQSQTAKKESPRFELELYDLE